MDQAELHRRVRVYVEIGLFEGKKPREAAEVLANRVSPIFGGTYERARAVDLSKPMLGLIAQMSWRDLLKEITRVFAEVGEDSGEELIDRLAGSLWGMLDHQERQTNAAWRSMRSTFPHDE